LLSEEADISSKDEHDFNVYLGGGEISDDDGVMRLSCMRSAATTLTDDMKGKALTNHVIQTSTVTQVSQCARKCMRHDQCQSFNYNSETLQCDINDAASADYPGDLVPQQGFDHYPI